MTACKIKRAKDLQTKHSDICTGFLEQALLKTKKAEPYLKEAVEFYQALQKVNSIEKLLLLKKYRDELATACGFSEKAKTKFSDSELNSAIKKVLTHIHKTSGNGFRENILYRYLLTKGDTLGGSMRNITGASAGTKLAQLVLCKLKKAKNEVDVVESKTGKIQRISWDKRKLFFDVKPSLIGKNIDLILLNTTGVQSSDEQVVLNDKDKYLACGELKGGIDPAGADEHWKTANSALGRIRTALRRSAPPLFFVGAAIEAEMSKEIFKQLRSGKLAYAANLNEEDQLNDLVGWLLSL